MKKRIRSNPDTALHADPHHDVYVMDADGTRLASRRLPTGCLH